MAAFGTASAVTAVAVLMLLAPVSSATLITKPYKTLGAQLSYNVSHGGCTKVSVQKTPTWAKKTGVFRTAGKVTSPSCPGQSSSNQGDFVGSVNLMGKLPFKTSGNHTVTAGWKIVESASWNVTPYTGCVFPSSTAFSACIAEADVEVFGYIFIDDLSNSTWGTYGYGYAIGGFNSVFNSTYSEFSNFGNFSSGTNGTFTGSMPFNMSLNLSGTSAINKNDNYTIQIYLQAYTFASAYTYNGAKGIGKASAKSSMDLGSLGKGAVLLGIAIV